MTDQILSHDVMIHIDQFLFGGERGKPTGPYKTLIYEQLKDYNNMSSLNTKMSIKYGKQNIGTYMPNKRIMSELCVDRRIKHTKTDAKQTYRLTDDHLNNEIPYENVRNWQFYNQPFTRLYRDIDLIEACNRIYVDSFQLKKKDDRLMERSAKKEQETMFRMKYVWMIFKMLKQLGTTKTFIPPFTEGFFDHLGEYIERDDMFDIIKWNKFPQLQHYLIYYQKHGITYFKGNKKWTPLRTPTEWLFDELQKIFPNETNLLYWCENIISFPTKITDDEEYHKLSDFLKHRDFYVFIKKLTTEVKDWRCEVLNNINSIRCFHTGKFFLCITRFSSYSVLARLRLSVVETMYHFCPSLTNSSILL